ncbi:MAG TPA: FtsQ-type POTRA domain-containing protein [Thermoanaerobaculia bacterium]|jgi:cell division protein FtsQ|nr:FtsQ-type POTRA domain-containing protein [Thermoanaerobaculia bacterium]
MTVGTATVVPPGAGGRILDFRRRGTPPRRRRRSLLLALARPLLAALTLVAVPSGLVAWVLTAPLFRLRSIEVGGETGRVAAGWVRQALAPLAGENLVRLSLAEAAARVQRNPWVASVEIAKELPDGLRVKVAERKPVALLLAGGGLVYADSEGRAIAPLATAAEVEEARRAGFLVVSFAEKPHSDGMAAALKVAAELGRVQPTWAAKLSRIEVLGEGDFRLRTDALPFPLLVTSGEVGPKVQRLVELLPELSRRYEAIQVVDLRFSRRIVVQPGSTGA